MNFLFACISIRFLICLGVWTFLSGCNGSAEISLIPLSTTKLTHLSRLEFDFHPQVSYWWIDEENRVNLTMGYSNLSFLGNYDRDSLEFSLVLEDLPADQTRQYLVNRDSGRGIWHYGPFHLRMKTLRGAVVIKKESPNTLSGLFRFFCASEKFDVLLGWEKQTQLLLQGHFVAVKNMKSGQKIRSRTEEGQLRSEQPTSAPATFIPDF